MFSRNLDEQTIIEFSQAADLGICAEAFLTDRQAAGLSRHTLKFYRQFLTHFLADCHAQALTLVQQVSADGLRRYFLKLAETHNPGGVHAAYRTLRAFLRWLAGEEVMAPGWRNPMLRVKAPRVPVGPIEPIAIEEVEALVATCEAGKEIGCRDRATFLVLVDTGVRAGELCAMDLEDTDLNRATILVRCGKGGKPRTVYLGRKTRRALRAYLRLRHDRCPALVATRSGERLTYSGLRLLLGRRARRAKLVNKPTLHDFRRAFALNMLRNGADIFALQRVMGHSDLQILRRYLAQSDQDSHLAHMRASPVDAGL
jgi:site-specific recombinase XerD